MGIILKTDKGVALIELLLALVISSLFIAASYRTFIHQQKTYVVQDQVADMQQNARVSIERMIEEIRMAGFGNLSTVLPVTLGTQTFANIVNPDSPAANDLTILSATGGTATITGILSQNQIVVSRLQDDQGNPLFDTADRRYISVGGLESHTIAAIDDATRTITLNGTLQYNHPVGMTLIFGIKAITYQVANENGVLTLTRDENTGDGPQDVAENVERIQFEYFDMNGNPTANPASIGMVKITLVARTNIADSEYKAGDGYRRREIACNIYIRNIQLSS
jgi:Tfp pilus assembly protein PilW